MSQVGLRKPRRTKIQLEDDLLNGLERLVARMGFTNIPLYMITQEANIDSNVFYRRYNNINELFALLAQRYGVYLNESVDFKDLERLGEREFLIKLLHKTFANISDKKVMQKLLVWELSDSNEVTRNSVILRDKMAQSFINHFTKISRGKGVDINSSVAILVAAIYYIAIYRSTYNSANTTMAFKGETGNRDIMLAIENFVNMLFDRLERGERLHRRINLMLADGISAENIQRYLELSSSEYEFILA